jgi:hypothetical protein
MARGERIMAMVFGFLGLFWVFKANDLTYADAFAPGPGFLPTWMGTGLVVLVATFLFGTRSVPSAPEGPTSGAVSWHKTAAVAAGLLACIVVIDWLGFVVSILGMLVYLFRVVERLAWKTSLGVSVGATLALYLIFHTWLRVPLPQGPWGF